MKHSKERRNSGVNYYYRHTYFVFIKQNNNIGTSVLALLNVTVKDLKGFTFFCDILSVDNAHL